MGYARWNHTDWSAYAASTTGRSTDAVFAARGSTKPWTRLASSPENRAIPI